MSKVKFEIKNSNEAIKVFGGNKEAFESKEETVILVGAAGTGKTFTLCLFMHLFAVKYPGARILLCRKSLPSLRNTVVKTYKEVLELTGYADKVRILGETRPQSFIYEERQDEWDGIKYSGVSEIILSQIDTKAKVLGSEYDMIYVNQPDTEGLTEEEFSQFSSRTRRAYTPYAKVLADPNPSHDRHWLLLGAKEGKWKLYQSFHEDNPKYYNHEKGEYTEAGKKHLKRLEMLPEHLRISQLEGGWYSTEGMVFGGCWNNDKHLLYLNNERAVSLGISKPFEFDGEILYRNCVPQGWHHYLAIDWGGTDPQVAILIARHPDKDLFIAHKHVYKIEPDMNKFGKLVAEMCAGYTIKNIIADTQRAETVTMENILGINITNAKKGAGSAEDSINIVTSQLNSDRWLFVNAKESLVHEPDYFLVEKKKLMGPEEIPNLKFDQNGKGIAKHQQDHYFDAIKYFMRYWNEFENSYQYPALVWI